MTLYQTSVSFNYFLSEINYPAASGRGIKNPNKVDKAFPPSYSESDNLDKGGDNIQMKGKKGSQS